MLSMLHRPTRLLLLAMAFLAIGGSFQVHPAAAVTDGDELAGDYFTKINSDEIPIDLANGASLIGRWFLSFDGAGAYVFTRADLGTVISGSYAIDGGSVTFTDEDGLLSCADTALSSGDTGDISSGSYAFDRKDDTVQFTTIEDGCQLRRVLLSDREFGAYVACATAGSGTPVATNPIDELIPDASPVAGHPSPGAAVTEAIDATLSQLNACWSAGDIDGFLTQLSDGYRDEFLTNFSTNGDPGEGRDTLASVAGRETFTFERVGEIRMEDETTATAVVRWTIVDEEQFVRFRFVLVNDVWFWDGILQ